MIQIIAMGIDKSCVSSDCSLSMAGLLTLGAVSEILPHSSQKVSLKLGFYTRKMVLGFCLCVDLIPYRVRVLYAALNVFVFLKSLKIKT